MSAPTLPERLIGWTAEITGQHVEPSTPWNNDLGPFDLRWQIAMRAEDALHVTLTDDDMEAFRTVGCFVDRVCELAGEVVE